MSALPVGKLKLLKKAVEGVEGAIDSSRAARLAQKCAECFLAGTKVLMADRSVTSIEAVRVGDQVLATDPVTGETGARRVTALIVTEDDKYLSELTLSTPRGEEKMTTIEEHPFWSPSAGKWGEAFCPATRHDAEDRQRRHRHGPRQPVPLEARAILQPHC
ncbi:MULTISPECIES: polymorphic toxin-type HINT domain-containing protein [Streptomyces]|uniref:Polymorphic toxin-type HINT domain-containing protein n=1 Tax=Streptomyces eurythermus TaxID=42237 RepID=A0ABW6YZ99_9ACTN